MAATTEMDLEDAVETAVISLISVAGITPRHAWEDDADRLTLPAIIVKAALGPGSFPSENGGTVGIWQVIVDVILRVQADDATEATWRTYWHSLRNSLVLDTLHSSLTGSNFKCWGVVWDHFGNRQVIDRHWEQSIRFTAHCQSAS